MPIIRSWSSPSGRVSLFEATRGIESMRETCPSTQIWLLLSGEWRESGDGQRVRLERFDTRRYAPKQPCRRIVEADSIALSIELFNVGGAPVFIAKELRNTWQIAYGALTTGFERLNSKSKSLASPGFHFRWRESYAWKRRSLAWP